MFSHVLILLICVYEHGFCANNAWPFHQVDNIGWTPLTIATRYGHVPIVKVLLKDPRIDEDKYLLCLASRFGNQEVVEALLDQPNIDVNIVGIKIFCGNAVTFMFLTIQSIIQTLLI